MNPGLKYLDKHNFMERFSGFHGLYDCATLRDPLFNCDSVKGFDKGLWLNDIERVKEEVK